MIRVYLLLALLFCGLAVRAEPQIIAMFPQHPINGKPATIWIAPLGKADEVRLVVMFRMREVSDKNMGPYIKVNDVEVAAENGDGQKMKVILESPDRAYFQWSSNLWQQNEYRLFRNGAESWSQVTIKWGGETTVFKMSEEEFGKKSIDWFFKSK